MVHASVTYNRETKKYDCKITDKGNPVIFNITTPERNVCILRNFPQPTTENVESFRRLDAFIKIHPQFAIPDDSLVSFFWVGTGKVYHPIRNVTVYCEQHISQDFCYLIESVNVDILIHVLEYDKQCRRDMLLEHQVVHRPQDLASLQNDLVSIETSVCKNEKSHT